MTASIDVYRSVSVGTTSPRHVIIKLYATAIRDLEEATGILGRGGDASEPLTRAQSIIGGLMSALDFEAGEMAKNLLQLYLFVLDRVHESQVSGKDAGLAASVKVLQPLLSAWEEMPAEEARNASRPLAATPGLNLRG
ncbi:flagellar protein FliS [bacterium]|nr:flagellar protein FliS [bacterium]